MRTFEFKIEIEMDFDSFKSEALGKLQNWLGHNYHTCSSYGFEIRKVNHLRESDQ